MFKTLVLQATHNLSDERTEYLTGFTPERLVIGGLQLPADAAAPLVVGHFPREVGQHET